MTVSALPASVRLREIFGHDEGIYVAEGANTQIDITATGKAGNNIHGNDNGIEVVGLVL